MCNPFSQCKQCAKAKFCTYKAVHFQNSRTIVFVYLFWTFLYVLVFWRVNPVGQTQKNALGDIRGKCEVNLIVILVKSFVSAASDLTVYR